TAPPATESARGSLQSGHHVRTPPCSSSMARIPTASQMQLPKKFRSPAWTWKGVGTAESGVAIHTYGVPGARVSTCASARRRYAASTWAAVASRAPASSAATGGLPSATKKSYSRTRTSLSNPALAFGARWPLVPMQRSLLWRVAPPDLGGVRPDHLPASVTQLVQVGVPIGS